ncbi:MAG: phage resistance protein, partial [Actinomycetes bacterium]
SDAANPVIREQLADVDYQSILDRVRAEDNSGRRKVLLRTLIHKALGVASGQDDLGGAASRSLIWRGSRREVDIVFGNVRDASSLPEQSFDHRPGTWRVVVDYPFDEDGYTSADDINRVDRLLTSGDRQTVVWLHRFLTPAAMDDLALLVKLDWLFTGTGDRWTENSDHLSATDRAQARGILENLLSGTRTSVENLLKQAYGIEAPDSKRITAESTQFNVLTSLSRGFDPQLPPDASLEDAFVNIVDQAYAATYTNHPEFDPSAEEVSARNFETVREYVEQASTHRDGRVPTNPGNDRKVVRRVAGPLRVGKATEDHFLFGEDSFAFWAGELDRAAQAANPVTVDILQKHIDALSPAWGLRPEARDLVISAWALLRKRAWVEAGSAITPPALGRLRPNIELRSEELPEQQVWDDARANASKLFGYTTPRTYLTGANVAEFAAQVRTKATEAAGDLVYLVEELDQAHARLGTEAGQDDRLVVARASHNSAEKMRNTSGNVALIEAMAGVELPLALETAAQIRTDAARDTRSLRNFKWTLAQTLQNATGQAGESADKARAIQKRIQEAITIPGRSLSDELTNAENQLVAWVVGNQPKQPNDEPKPPSGKFVVNSADDITSLAAELTTAMTNENKTINVHWWVE